MDDAYGYEERGNERGGGQIITNGDYLCIQYEGQPRHIYRRIEAEAALHPLISRQVYDGELYGLVWIEDDE